MPAEPLASYPDAPPATPTAYLSLTAASKAVPGGRPVNTSTIWRWCRKGMNGVRLRYLRVGRSILTTQQWMLEFFEALAAADPAPCRPRRPEVRMGKVRSDEQRERAVADAEETCKRLGL